MYRLARQVVATMPTETSFELHKYFSELQIIFTLRKTILVCDNAFAGRLLQAGLRCNVLVLYGFIC